MNVKGNLIIYIGDGIETLLRIKDYYVFEDNWITEYAKILYDKDGNEYEILDFQETEDYICDERFDTHEYEYPLNTWRWTKRSCVKLDKKANIGDILFIKN